MRNSLAKQHQPIYFNSVHMYNISQVLLRDWKRFSEKNTCDRSINLTRRPETEVTTKKPISINSVEELTCSNQFGTFFGVPQSVFDQVWQELSSPKKNSVAYVSMQLSGLFFYVTFVDSPVVSCSNLTSLRLVWENEECYFISRLSAPRIFSVYEIVLSD
ncbi:MAG: hypothetical protein D3910_02295 [Candidatus Electrothrix sp. ATG2]|nr:hypothetical protein [Candidatus Electrothrix sp. ATG2]